MFKRFRWVFVAMAGIGSILCLTMDGVGRLMVPKKCEDDALARMKPAPGSTQQALQVPEGEHGNAKVRESRRHAAGEVGKYRLHRLERAVRDQEDKVEERRKVLATIVRTKGITYRGVESPLPVQTPDEVSNSSLDGQVYVDAKSEFEAEQEVLQRMKLRLIGERLLTARKH